MDEVADSYLTSIFYVVRDFRRGSLSDHLTADAALMAWVRDLAEQLPIEADTKHEEVSVTISRQAAGEYWHQRNKVANFLKHADRDAGAALALDEVDNLMLLMQCYSAYTDLIHDDLGNEGLVFQLFIGSSQSLRSRPTSQREELIQKLSAVPEEGRRHLCSSLIAELNQP
jgi:hypothetical protein